MSQNTEVAHFIASQRAALERLEVFARTPEFERLLATLRPFVEDDPVKWLAGWLIEPDTTLATRPVEIVVQPGGLEVLIDRLERLAGGNCA